MNRLVVIDDEYIVVEGIKAMIARLNLDYQVTGWAYDGIRGLEVIEEQKPDLVITDIRIPGMDGLSVIETAREYCPDTAFIVISGYTEFEYARRALTLGVKSYIDKPISMEKLKKALEDVEKARKRAEQKVSEKDEEVRARHKEMEQLFESGIREMTRGDVEMFHKDTEKTLEMLGELYPETEDFRRESYKHLCVLCDIFIESHSQVSRASLVSYQEMEKKKNGEEIRSYAKSVLSDIEKYLAADSTGSSHRVILELLNYIEEHYNEDIGLSELADRAGMSTAYLSVLFKAEVGTSYVKYLTGLRIRKAKKLLMEGYRVNEVSEMVGYSNYRYFCDIFKKHEGQTPNEYKSGVWKQK